MNKHKLLALILSIVQSLTVSCYADSTIELWSLTNAHSESHEEFQLNLKDIQENKPIKAFSLIKMDLDSLKSLKIGQQISVEVSNKQRIIYSIDKILPQSGNITTIETRRADKQPGEFLLITFSNNQFIATIASAEDNYSIRGLNNVGIIFKESDIAFEFTESLISKSVTQSKTMPYKQEHSESTLKSEQETVIDLFVVTSGASDGYYNGNADPTIYHKVAVANKVFTDSAVQTQLNVIAIERFDSIDFETISVEGISADLRFDAKPVYIDIKKRAYEAGADIIAIMSGVFKTGSFCGAATPGEELYTRYGVAGFEPIISVYLECQDRVLAHEVGHVLGLDHSRKQSKEGFSFPYALGYGVEGNFVTIMAYPTEFQGSIYGSGVQSKYIYSSPDFICNGLPCGIDRHDDANGADAAYALRQTHGHIAKIGTPAQSLQTFQDLLDTGISLQLESCIANTDSIQMTDYTGMLSELRCIYHQGFDLFELSNFPRLIDFTLQASNLSDLSPFLQLSENIQIQNLNLWNNNISDIGPVTSLWFLKEITLSDNPITDLSPLATLEFLSYINLQDTPASDISPLFSLIDKSLTHLVISRTNTIYCWQIDYLSLKLDRVDAPDTCSANDDANDYDNDGLSNMDELKNGTDPTIENIVEIEPTPSNNSGSMSFVLIAIMLSMMSFTRVRYRKKFS